MKTILYKSSLVLLLMSNILFAEEKSVRDNSKPICRLIVNDICDSAGQVYSVQLSGIDCYICYDEHFVQDTLFLTITELNGNRFRNASYIQSPSNTFFIRINLDEDTAEVMVDLSDGNSLSKLLYNPGFICIEPLLEIDPDIFSVEIPLETNQKNTFTINNLIRQLNRSIDEEIDFVFPPEGTYRCFRPFWLVRKGKQKWFESDEGIILFLKPGKPIDKGASDNIMTILDELRSSYSEK